MSDTMRDFLDEFFEEFQYRIDALAAHSDEGVRKELLFLLVENLILKYENRLQKDKKGLLSKLFPFLATNGNYDKEFEDEINREIDNLVNFESEYPNSQNGSLNQKFSDGFSQIAKDASENKSNQLLDDIKLIEGKILPQSNAKSKFERYSKTNIPINIDLALELNLLPKKEQDHLDYFVLTSGISGIILCDGVSGDGEQSADLAQTLPKHIINYFKKRFKTNISLNDWKSLVIDGVNYALDKYANKKGASTLLIGIVDSINQQIYISWIGDGNLIYFNETMTGFSKLLTPHNDSKGRLTRVVTAEGLLGKPSVQIISGVGGALILSSDGYNLSNGRILKHFFQRVLRARDMNSGLREWTNSNCCQEVQLHPNPTDDRSIGVIRWNTVFNEYRQRKHGNENLENEVQEVVD